MQNHVRRYIAGCEVCWKRKHPINKKQASMQLVRTGVPMQRIATDILGELSETENGNNTACLLLKLQQGRQRSKFGDALCPLSKGVWQRGGFRKTIYCSVYKKNRR
ncbi:Hypothetical predicted protein [Mytilus galloprovincialis]|uniref:Integrase zinc-binding domain-containing protein n=1 Tax=Mytilus galloprovincialis TaxID=29158 RepID=A0A8B6DB12_MYTGA|nr:Hypothetical predicted protein [Mytilus galloprovincialis]